MTLCILKYITLYVIKEIHSKIADILLCLHFNWWSNIYVLTTFSD